MLPIKLVGCKKSLQEDETGYTDSLYGTEFI